MRQPGFVVLLPAFMVRLVIPTGLLCPRLAVLRHPELAAEGSQASIDTSEPPSTFLALSPEHETQHRPSQHPSRELPDSSRRPSRGPWHRQAFHLSPPPNPPKRHR